MRGLRLSIEGGDVMFKKALVVVLLLLAVAVAWNAWELRFGNESSPSSTVATLRARVLSLPAGPLRDKAMEKYLRAKEEDEKRHPKSDAQDEYLFSHTNPFWWRGLINQGFVLPERYQEQFRQSELAERHAELQRLEDRISCLARESRSPLPPSFPC